MALDSGAQSYRLASGILSVPAEGEAVILSIDTGKYFGLSGAFQHLLEPLREGLTRDEMIAMTCARYDVPADEAAADLDRVLAELVEAKIVERSAG